MRDIVVLWVLVGCGALCLSVWNYWCVSADTRKLTQRRINGEIAFAASDDRQAEMFRIVCFASFALAGVLAGFGLPGSHADVVVRLLIFGLVIGGASALRSALNRRQAWARARKKTWPEIDRRAPEPPLL